MTSPKYSAADFAHFCQVIFERALMDVNAIRPADNPLKEPFHVSFQSFEKYISEHHPLIHRESSAERLSMVLYKKAIDDIAFQADIFGFLLREIPIQNQRASCEYAVRQLKRAQDLNDSQMAQ